MTEETAQQTTPAAETPAETPQPSNLEKVYQEFNVEEAAANFSPQQEANTQQQHQDVVAPRVPDPFDPSFQEYQRSVSANMAALMKAMGETRANLTAMQTQMVKDRTEADIRTAVSQISKKAGIEPSIAEVALEAQARQDPRLLAIWNNRHKNPKALDAALNALSEDFKQKFSVRQDPQLVENQRAVSASRQTMATTSKETEQDKWTSMSPADRQREIAKLIASGGR